LQRKSLRKPAILVTEPKKCREMSRFGDRPPIYKPDCLPGGQDALLGMIPLKALGVEPDLQHQQLSGCGRCRLRQSKLI
jgi:hypothetical protein